MPARPIWRGHLRLALVSCPVALVPARHERNNLHFNLINPDTGNRIRMVTQDAETGEELERSALVRGYEFRKDHYVLLTDEDFDSARIESSSTLSIEKFVDQQSIDPLYFDAAYLMVPDGEAGQDVYVVLREAILRTRKLALSRLVLGRRERAVAIAAHGRGLVLHTLEEADDLADLDAAFDTVPKARPDAAMVKLAEQLIARQAGQYDPADSKDRYEARLRALIDAKIAGSGFEPEDAPEETGKVVDLMEALKQSLKEGKRTPPKAGKAPPAPARRPAPNRRAAGAKRAR